jgi:hypothetical protein
MTLRDAAERTARSVTTLRRYIRSGRLRAEKAYGRYGPEYLISDDALAAAGLPAEAQAAPPAHALRAGEHALVPLEHALRDLVPATLYHELQLKHEQLLVQYGMVRAGGLRLLELRGEVEEGRRALAQQEAEHAALRERAAREIALVRKKLRETELELEGRSLELSALREKVRTLERLTRPQPEGAVERQISQVGEQMRRVERLESLRPRQDEPEH